MQPMVALFPTFVHLIIVIVVLNLDLVDVYLILKEPTISVPKTERDGCVENAWQILALD